MNGIDELVREWAPVPEDDVEERVAGDIARRRLRRAIADERRPRRWRLTLPVVVAGGLAALILAIVALLPARDANAPAPASAATVLEHVARVATHQPARAYPGPHQYLYLKFQERWTLAVSFPARGRAAKFRAYTVDTQQDWVAVNGSGRQRMIAEGQPRFLTPRDRAGWVAAGKPRWAPTCVCDGTYPPGGYPAGNQLDPAGLPVEPQQLLRVIVKRFEGGRFQLQQTFETVGTLLQDSGSPTLRAALYRMVARLPGVKLLGRRTDPLGRSGVAVGTSTGEELLFDPATSDILEESDVQLGPGALPAGTVLHYFVYQGRGVVNSIEQLPGGGTVPLHRGRP